MLIADAVIIGNAPIILLDEIENAGIHRTRALELLRQYRKIFIFVTHDPRIALLSDYRIVMGQGAMRQIIDTDAEEKRVAEEIGKIDDLLLDFRNTLRSGAGWASGTWTGCARWPCWSRHDASWDLRSQHEASWDLWKVSMRAVICAGPPTCGKTTVLKHVVRKLKAEGLRLAYLKIDVQYADEDEMFRDEFGIPVKKVYSGELCPDHCNVMVLGDAIDWAEQEKADFLLVETAGLCLRCSPYIDGSLGIVVLEATSGMNLPRKIGPMLSLADVAVVTKIDLVSQAEREVFRARILETAPGVRIVETDALYGIGVDPLVRRIKEARRSWPRLLPARQPAGGHLHDLRGEEGDRLEAALRRGPAAGRRDVLPGENKRGEFHE